jgi:hypothetical protein
VSNTQWQVAWTSPGSTPSRRSSPPSRSWGASPTRRSRPSSPTPHDIAAPASPDVPPWLPGSAEPSTTAFFGMRPGQSFPAWRLLPLTVATALYRRLQRRRTRSLDALVRRPVAVQPPTWSPGSPVETMVRLHLDGAREHKQPLPQRGGDGYNQCTSAPTSVQVAVRPGARTGESVDDRPVSRSAMAQVGLAGRKADRDRCDGSFRPMASVWACRKLGAGFRANGNPPSRSVRPGQRTSGVEEESSLRMAPGITVGRPSGSPPAADVVTGRKKVRSGRQAHRLTWDFRVYFSSSEPSIGRSGRM